MIIYYQDTYLKAKKPGYIAYHYPLTCNYNAKLLKQATIQFKRRYLG